MPLQALAAVVLDDDAGGGGEVGLEVGVGPPEVAGGDGDAGVVEAPRERAALDQELDLEAGRQDRSSILTTSSVWQTARHLMVSASAGRTHPEP